MDDQLTPRDLAIALEPLALLPNAPALTEALYGFLLGLFREEGVTGEELRAAVVETLKTETFWPGPAALMKAIKMRRGEQQFAADQLIDDRERRRRSDSRRLLDLVAEADAVLYDRIVCAMREDMLAQDAVHELGVLEEVRKILKAAGVPTEGAA